MNHHESLPFMRLDAYRLAREVAKIVHESKIRDAELRDQASRASKSCFLQLCEGLPSDSGAMRRRVFTCADGSLHETVGAVDLAWAIGAMNEEHARAVIALASRLRPVLRGLLR